MKEQNITVDETAAAGLKENEQIPAQIIEKTPIPSFVIDSSHKVIHWNKACEDLTGITADRMIGTSSQWRAFYDIKQPVLADLIAENKSLQEIAALYKNINCRDPLIPSTYECEKFFPALGKNGKWLFFTAAPIMDTSGRIIGAIETLQDITSQKFMENKLKSLASQLTLSEERERRNIAVILHDDIIQKLILLKIKLGLTGEKNLPSGLSEILNETYNLLDDVIQDSRELTFDLSSPILYELGLKKALKQFLNNTIGKRHRIKTSFSSSGEITQLEDDMRAILYRSVKELLFNTVKHADAENIKVSVDCSETDITISVVDDGIGFSMEEHKKTVAEKESFGLFSINERLAQLGGTFTVCSEKGKGCRITLSAPLKSYKRA